MTSVPVQQRHLPLYGEQSHGLEIKSLVVVEIANIHFVNRFRFKMDTMYRVIRNDCRSFNNLSYTIHLR